MGSADSSNDLCRCGHIRFRHQREDADDRHCAIPSCRCTDFQQRVTDQPAMETVELPEGPKPCTCGPNEACGDPCVPAPEEPPLTPEEEEQAPPDTHDWHHATPEAGLTCKACGLAHKNWSGEDCPEAPENEGVCAHPNCTCAPEALCPGVAKPPPQPQRRPPFAVAYSVQGHLYEVALPGDATVKAVDGALVIQHHLGPVAGIVQVLPVIGEST